jgi:23S rRNA pseudouridine2605 synthase
MTDSKSSSTTVRLNRWIAQSGLCSRREADRLIEEGRVKVNGVVVTTMGEQVTPGKTKVTVNGKPLPTVESYYLLLNKPAGLITTRSDENGRRTIYQCLPENLHSVVPAGRLDKDSSGALILSNDGDFIYRLTHPSFHVPKRYKVWLNKPINQAQAEALASGIMLEPEQKLAKMEQIVIEEPNLIVVTLITGYNRQIRRSIDAVGLRVQSLKRISIGSLVLGNLKPGDFRHLKPNEIKLLTQPGRPESRPGKHK